MRKWIRPLGPLTRVDAAILRHLDQAGIELCRDRRLFHLRRADEHELLTAVAPGLVPSGLDTRDDVRVGWPAILRSRRPPVAARLMPDDSAGLAQLAHEDGPRRNPEETFRANHAWPRPIEKGMQLVRHERPTCAIDEA